MASSNHKTRNRMSVMIGVLVIIIVALASYFSHNIPETVAGQLARPALLDGARVTAGDPFWFWFDNGPAEFKISPQSTQELLHSHRVFNDCDHPGRVCHSPIWSANFGFDLDGVETPPNALCASSSDVPESAEVNMHTICIDPKTDSLYYLDFTLGGR
jgi:hypothetical protein